MNFCVRYFCLIMCLYGCLSGRAQSQSFEEFRKGFFKGYDSFRTSILENYDSFLEKAWVDYDVMRGKERNPVPKPVIVPGIRPDEKPTPDVVVPEERNQNPKPAPKPISEPESESPTIVQGYDRFRLTPDIELEVPHVSYEIARNIGNEAAAAEQWRTLSHTELPQKIVPAFKALAEKHGLNDYLIYTAVSTYADTRFAGCSSLSRKSLVHFILANLGYDVRLATDTSGEGLLLLPFKQMAYGVPYLDISGRRYFVFADNNVEPARLEHISIRTCQLPADAAKGDLIDLKITPLKLPYIPGEYNLSCAGLTLQGTYNKAVIPLLFRYPQMPMAEYAESNVLPEVRKSLVEQVQKQLCGRKTIDKVEVLLGFVQKAFGYATDTDNHGFEKPYFIEEMLFYPKNDCEDRAMFYAYLLWEALGVPCQLINYPGHESVGVAHCEGMNGDSYTDGKSTYYISDPTYIGAATGMCMPMFKNCTPTVDYSYIKQ